MILSEDILSTRSCLNTIIKLRLSTKFHRLYTIHQPMRRRQPVYTCPPPSPLGSSIETLPHVTWPALAPVSTLTPCTHFGMPSFNGAAQTAGYVTNCPLKLFPSLFIRTFKLNRSSIANKQLSNPYIKRLVTMVYKHWSAFLRIH